MKVYQRLICALILVLIPFGINVEPYVGIDIYAEMVRKNQSTYDLSL